MLSGSRSTLTIAVAVERFPIAGVFTIARGSRTEAVVVTVTVSDGRHFGRGECVPYARYGETAEAVVAGIEAAKPELALGGGPSVIANSMIPGAARNALDCALLDLEAKQAGLRIWDLLGMPAPAPVLTCYTLSLGTPEAMQAAAESAAGRALLKVKLGGEGDSARIAAVRRGAPRARLVVDANESWTAETLAANAAACADAGVELIEQPLPAAADGALEGFRSPVMLCADESVHSRDGLADVARRYQAINIKLDKTGGLTEALLLRAEADRLGLGVMVGCMVGTSLAMAPAMLLTPGARFVDLDGPLLLAEDRKDGLTYTGSMVSPPEAALWG